MGDAVREGEYVGVVRSSSFNAEEGEPQVEGGKKYDKQSSSLWGIADYYLVGRWAWGVLHTKEIFLGGRKHKSQ